MLKGLFITGTDTGVGKTTAAAAVMHRFRPEARLRYWKPVQTGIEQDDDTATVGILGACRAGELKTDGIRLKGPVAPYLAARMAAAPIRLSDIPRPGDEDANVAWVIEGAGGVLVPINETDFMIDLMAQFSLPVLVIARSTLGTINHTLLTLQALRQRGLQVEGVLMVGPPDLENRKAIEKYGNVAVVGQMPWFDTVAADALKTWALSQFDPGNVLSRALK